MPHSFPLSGKDSTLGQWIPHHSSEPKRPRRLRKANPSRIWCWSNTMTSEMSSPKKPLMNSHHRRHGTMPLTLHLGLSSLAPGHSPYPLQNRRSLTTSSVRTSQMAPSIHPSLLGAPMFFIKRRMDHSASYRTIGN